jgi:DNA gyrase subunit B
VTVRRAGKTYLQSFGRGYPGVFAGTEFDPDAEFTRDDTQKLKGVGNRKPDLHGTTVRILFDPTVVPDSSIDINEVLLRAHAAARMSRVCIWSSSTKAGPVKRSGPNCWRRSAGRGAPTPCWT